MINTGVRLGVSNPRLVNREYVLVRAVYNRPALGIEFIACCQEDRFGSVVQELELTADQGINLLPKELICNFA